MYKNRHKEKLCKKGGDYDGNVVLMFEGEIMVFNILNLKEAEYVV